MRLTLVGDRADPPPRFDGSLDEMRAALDRAMALLYLMHARTCELEQSNAELRALAGLDPPPPTLGAQWVSLKQASHLTDHAESTVRSWIAAGKIEARKLGGRTLINVESLPPRCETVR
jgi:hypothetical protein